MVLPAGPSAAIVVERLFLRGWQVEAGQRGMAVGTDAMAAAEQMVGLTRCIALHAKNSPALPSATVPASSLIARATRLAALATTGPSELPSAVNSSCKDFAWEASCPSGVTGPGKKNLGKNKAAPDDDRRRRVVFGNVAFDIIQI